MRHHHHLTVGTRESLQLCRLLSPLMLLLVALQPTDSQPATRTSYSAICVVAKDENRYLAEWVQYHKCLGIGKIYLYDHNSTVPLYNGIEEHIQDGFVEHVPFTGEHTRWQAKDGFADNLAKFTATIQGKAYQDCLERYSSRHAFIGFIDVDEFVVLYDKGITRIDDLLKRYEGYGGLSLYWVLLGSGGHKTAPALPVTQSYLKCVPQSSKPNTQFKSFVNTAFRPTMYSPHRALFTVNSSTSYLVDENSRRIAAGRNKNSTHAIAAVYHYVTKSQQDFNAKLSRGGGAGVTRTKTYIRILDLGCRAICLEAALQYARTCALPLTDATRAELASGGEEQQQLLSQLERMEAERHTAPGGFLGLGQPVAGPRDDMFKGNKA